MAHACHSTRAHTGSTSVHAEATVIASAWTFRAKNVSFLSWDEEHDLRRDLQGAHLLCAVVWSVDGNRSGCM